MSTRRKSRIQSGMSGFSLVELMVVIAIIGVLSTVVVVAVASRIKKARKTSVIADFKAIDTAIELFVTDTGRYPDSLEDLLQAPPNANQWDGPYLKTGGVPRDPWGYEYIYRKGGGSGARRFELMSNGADGVEGGEEEEADIHIDELDRSRGGNN